MIRCGSARYRSIRGRLENEVYLLGGALLIAAFAMTRVRETA